MKLNILSGGAAQAVVDGLAPDFERETGHGVQGTFGAVGMMRDRLLAGDPCDVLILTAALIAELETRGAVVAGSARPLGKVGTGVAVRKGDAPPRVDDGDALKATLLAASAIYIPDQYKSTAGIHVLSVLQRLGIDETVAGRLRAYPNGATAMRALAASAVPGEIGCTQVTEILYTPGISLVAPLPSAYGLDTVYTAAVSTTSADPALAERFVALLSGASTQALRVSTGIVI